MNQLKYLLSHDDMISKNLQNNAREKWTCMDYDEVEIDYLRCSDPIRDMKDKILSLCHMYMIGFKIDAFVAEE